MHRFRPKWRSHFVLTARRTKSDTLLESELLAHFGLIAQNDAGDAPELADPGGEFVRGLVADAEGVRYAAVRGEKRAPCGLLSGRVDLRGATTRERTTPADLFWITSSLIQSLSALNCRPAVLIPTPSRMVGTPSILFHAPAGVFGTLSGLFGSPATIFGASSAVFFAPAGLFDVQAALFGASSGRIGSSAVLFLTSASLFGIRSGLWGSCEAYFQEIAQGAETE